MRVIKLVEEREPVAVVLPCGSTHTVVPFGAAAVPLLRQYRTETDPIIRAVLLPELLQAALPTATAEELEDTSPEDWARILGAASGKLDVMEEILKNGVSGGVDLAPPPTPPSSTMTTSEPPVPVSPDGKADDTKT